VAIQQTRNLRLLLSVSKFVRAQNDLPSFIRLHLVWQILKLRIVKYPVP